MAVGSFAGSSQPGSCGCALGDGCVGRDGPWPLTGHFGILDSVNHEDVLRKFDFFAESTCFFCSGVL